MPGSKRKLDEETWWIYQSKRTKKNQLSETVFESTLAKLWRGARTYFNPEAVARPPGWVSPSLIQPDSSSPASANPIPVEDQSARVSTNICADCKWNGSNRQRSFSDKCNFCEQTVCHVNVCSVCSDQFCQDCYIRKYDDPSVDTYVCISCLR